MSRTRWTMLAMLGAAIVAVAMVLTGFIGSSGPALLTSARTWHYQLQNLDQDARRLESSPADLLVIDFSMSQGGRAMKPFSTDEVERLKQKPDGGRRVVLAYISIGEAEEYRYYWRAAWKQSPPDFLIAENCRWPRNHLVRFWADGWKDIMIRGASSYLARIQAAGFDGVYLDRVDVYDDIEDRHPEARARMIDFVAELAATARSRRPGFLVVAQNAEDLLQDRRYRSIIDGLGKEDLLYGLVGTGRRNSDDDITWSRKQLELLKRDRKPVFVAEYLTSADTMQSARAELGRLGFVPVFPTRALDGADPLLVRTRSDLAREYGTPEYSELSCNGVWKKS